ncbi:MAG: hypothetical protein ABR878_05235 [Roseiarcus sp.]|jgi:uncharacterized Zn finger protein
MRDYGYYGFPPYVPVAKRREQAARELAKLVKKGHAVAPVVIEGRQIARSFWGKAWCDNLELYSDFESRLPRGRAYVRNGSVIDLQIARGSLRALVSGSEIYQVKIDIALAASSRWQAICRDCAGSIGSLVELLQGKLSKNVMERVCREGEGLFPAPREIKMACSCPDGARMCKHVAATLYGVGARLDTAPDLLFMLRGVDRAELISTAGAGLRLEQAEAASGRILADDDVAALFGIEIAAPPARQIAEERKRERPIAIETPAQAAKPRRGRGEKKSTPSLGHEMRKAAENEAGEPPRYAAAIPARRGKAASATESSAAKGKRPEPVKNAAPASDKTMENKASDDEASTARPNVKSRGSDEAPAGRTRAAKWIGARARKARG